MQISKHLVTGGSGFIGSALVKRLVTDGLDVRVFDNNLRGVKSRLDDVFESIEFIEGDIRNYEQVKIATEGIDIVHHLAYLNGTEYFYKMPSKILEIAVKGMMNIIDACKENNIKEMFVASSSEVYQTPKKVPTSENERLIVPNPLNPRFSYGGGKILWELMSINFGREHFDRVVIYRPHNVYGPDMGWEHVLPQFATRMKKIIDSNEEKDTIDFNIQGTGNETRAFVYIDDFIEGVMKLIENGEHLNIYNIGTSDEVSIKELAVMVGSVYDKKVNVLPGEITEGSTIRRCPDITKIMDLGYSPKVSMKEGVKKLVTWYREHINDEKKINLTT